MSSKFNVFCVVALLIQTITGQCIGNSGALAASGYGFAANGNSPGISQGYGGISSALTNGGVFTVTCTSPIAPTGISVLAEKLVIEGPLSVGGSLPLIGVVAVEGALPTGGQAGASYSCGNGNIGIVSEHGGANAGLGVPNGGIANAGLGVPIGGIANAGLGVPNGGFANAAGLCNGGLANSGLGGAGLGLGTNLGYGNRIL